MQFDPVDGQNAKAEYGYDTRNFANLHPVRLQQNSLTTRRLSLKRPFLQNSATISLLFTNIRNKDYDRMYKLS